MAENTQRVMEEGNDYKFLKISDAILSVNQKVSLTGVVVECGIPEETSGSSSFCCIKICDDSHSKLGIAVNIFAEKMKMLPSIASLGDIIQLSDITMKTHGGEAYALFNQKISSFALYKGKDGEDFIPYQSSLRFCRRYQDKKLIAGLRKWLCHFQLDEDSNDFMYLREIKEGNHINLACKILHMSEVAPDACLAFVWDGTDTPPNRISPKQEDSQSPFPYELQLISMNLLRSFPAAGSFLKVTIDQSEIKHINQLLRTGKWVKLINVLCQVKEGLWHVMLSHYTRLRYVSNEDHLILERERSYKRRLLDFGYMPYWSFPRPSRVAETSHDNIPPLTLRNILIHSKVTAKFKCVVQVTNVFPPDAENFRSPAGIYRIRLTLVDPTARVNAFVYAEDGEKFFDGYPPVEILKRKMSKLLGVAVSNDGKQMEDAPRNPPWVECCLKSYCLDVQNKRATRRYRIFDTKLIG